MNSKRISLLTLSSYLLILNFLIVSGCKKETTPSSGVPNVLVSFSIDINLPSYTSLTVPGGCMTVSGGYLNHGVIIYNAGNGQFYAMDATCTYNISGYVKVQKGSIFAEDSTCGSIFTLSSGGTVDHGPASLPLKNYQTSFDGTYLTVSN